MDEIGFVDCLCVRSKKKESQGTPGFLAWWSSPRQETLGEVGVRFLGKENE